MKFYNFHSNKIDISENTHVIQVRFGREENIKYFMYLLSLTNISSVTNNEDKIDFIDVNLDLHSLMFY